MNVTNIIATFSLLLSAYWLFKKPNDKKIESYLTKIHFLLLGLTMFTIGLLFGGFRFIGQYTNSITGLLFLSSGILLFGLTTSRGVRTYSSLIAIPSLLIELSILFGGSPLLIPALVGYAMFAPPLKKEKVNHEYNIEVHQGVLLAPPNLFYLTKQTAFIFDKQIRLNTSEHPPTISKLVVVSFIENENVVCKIYTGDNSENFSIDTLWYHK